MKTLLPLVLLIACGSSLVRAQLTPQLTPLRAETPTPQPQPIPLNPELFRPVAPQTIQPVLVPGSLVNNLVELEHLKQFLAQEIQQPTSVADLASSVPQRQEPDPNAQPIPQPALIFDTAVSPSSYEQESGSQDSDKPTTQDPEAQPAPATQPQQELEALAQQIEARKGQVEGNAALDETAKKEAMTQLNAAGASIQKAIASRNERDKMKAENESSDSRREKLKEELATPLVALSPEPSASLEDLGTKLQQKEAELDTLKNEQKEIRDRIAKRETEKSDLPGKRMSFEEEIRRVRNALNELANQPESPARELTRLVLESELKFYEQELERLAVKSVRLEQEGRTLPLRRDQVARKIKNLEAEIEAWRTQIEKKRQLEIDRQKQEAKREAIKAMEQSNELLRELAQTNQELASQREKLNSQLKALEEEQQRITQTSDKIEKNRSDLKEKIEIGLTTTTGILLVEHRRSLVPAAKSQNRLAELTAKVREAQAAKLALSEQRDTISTSDEAIDTMIQAHASAFENMPDDADPQERVRSLLETQLNLADALLNDYSEDYIPKLTSLEQAHRSLIKNIELSREFTTENALWVRSANPISLDDLTDSTSGVQKFLNYRAWMNLAESIVQHISTRPYEITVLVIFVGGLFMVQRRLKATHE